MPPPHLQRNFLAHCLEGGFYMAGLVFVMLETVLPSFVQRLGGAPWLISIMPALLPATFNMLGLFIAPFVERMHQFKTFVCTFGALQRLPYLVAGLLMLLVPMSDHTLLWVVMLAPLLSGLVGGIGVQAWMEMVTRMIPPNRRASGWAIRYQISNAIGLVAGVVVHQVLSHHPNAHGYAILHLICFGFLVLSWTSQLCMIEPPDPHPLRLPRPSYGSYLRSVPGLLRSQPYLVRFILARFTGTGYLMMVAFMSIYALDVTHAAEADKGHFVTVQMAGSIFGSFFAARIGDRHGGRAAMLIARLLCVALCVALCVTQSFTGFLIAYFALSFGLFTDRVGDLTLAAELCPYERRATYQAALGFCQAVCLISAMLLGGLIYHFTKSFHAIVALSAVFSAISVLILRTIPEARMKHHPLPATGETPPVA
jgi:MFS family permease